MKTLKQPLRPDTKSLLKRILLEIEGLDTQSKKYQVTKGEIFQMLQNENKY